MALPAAFAVVRRIGGHVTTTLSGSVGIPVPDGANGMWIQARVQDVYIRFDGAPASANGGFQLRAGDPPVLLVLPSGSGITAVQGASGAILESQGVYIE